MVLTKITTKLTGASGGRIVHTRGGHDFSCMTLIRR